MSLINQMLQDLDARRAEADGARPYGEQVRAVPLQRRIHPAWSVAAALAVALAGVLGWLVLRPAPTVDQAGASAQLPLKFASNLGKVPPAAPQDAAQAAVFDASTLPHQDDGANRPVTASLPNTTAPEILVNTVAMPTQRSVQAPPSAPASMAREKSPLPAPEMNKVLPASPALVAPPETKHYGQPAPITATKQFKEPTPQQRAENEYRKALSSIQQEKAADAIGALEHALQLDPLHAGARQALIGMLIESKRSDDAARKASEGLNHNAAQPELAMILARLQLEKGELSAALDTLERTLPHAGGRPDYRAFLAALLQRAGKHKQATEHYLLALQKSPQNGVWWMGLGISFQAENRLPEAQEAFKRAKATNSLTAELLAFVENRLGQLQR